MTVGEVIGSIIEGIIKIAVAIFIITHVYKWAIASYDFGYRVFTEKPMSVGEGRIISVEISEDDNGRSIGQMLEDKGLIRDKNVFFVQELLSEHRGKEQPGIYDLTTAMTADEILAVISPKAEEKESGE